VGSLNQNTPGEPVSRARDGHESATGRKPVTEFKVTALKELAEQQTRYAPPARRQAQVAAAQKLFATGLPTTGPTPTRI
jgi:hypothetical protein